jgi:DNA modification methylase
MIGSQEASWRVYFHTSEKMHEVEDTSAQIAVASPPFTNNADGKTLDKQNYLDFLQQVFHETSRILRPGGILVTVNTDLRDHARYNGGDTRFNGLVWHKHSAIRRVAENIGFRCVDTKIWAKSLKRNVYRYNFAYIQFFKKLGMHASNPASQKVSREFGPDVWLLERGTYRRDAEGFIFRDAVHPEIVRRCLEQYTSPGDLVISPFTGSGTVVAVAKMMGRPCIGYEVNRSLRSLIELSIETPILLGVYRELGSK